MEKFFVAENPEYVFLAAAKIGGIGANSEAPADFMYQNMMIATNVIHEAWIHDCKKLVFLGSSFVYPKFAPQPIKENSFLTCAPESSHKTYAMAKIIDIKDAVLYYLEKIVPIW